MNPLQVGRVRVYREQGFRVQGFRGLGVVTMLLVEVGYGS